MRMEREGTGGPSGCRSSVRRLVAACVILLVSYALWPSVEGGRRERATAAAEPATAAAEPAAVPRPTRARTPSPHPQLPGPAAVPEDRSVRGRVQAVDARPVAGARVAPCALPPGSADLGGPAEPARTGADGRFELLDVPEDAGVCVQADGFAPAAVDLGREREHEILVVLLPAAVIRGRVVLAGSGAPVAGARVTVGEDPDATTDAEGAFTWRAASARPILDDWLLRARTPGGYGETSVSALAPGQQLEGVVIRVHGATTVAGQVLVVGEPCPAGEVVLQTEHAGLDTAAPIGPAGRFQIWGVLPGPHVAYARCEHRSSSEVRFEVPPGAPVELRLELDAPAPAGTVTGLVTDRAGVPIDQARVLLVAGADDAYANTADRRGRYTFTDVPVGRYRLLASAWGEETAPLVIEVAADVELEPPRLVVPARRDEHAADAEEEPAAPAPVLGRVRSHDGQPVPGALVSTRQGPPVATDADGCFEVVGEPDGEPLQVWTRDGRRAHARVAPGAPVEITLPPPGRCQLAGTVRTASGEAPERFRVLVSYRGELLSRTFFRTDGRFSLDALPAGEARVVASASLPPGEGSARVVLRDGQPATVTLTLEPDGEVDRDGD